MNIFGLFADEIAALIAPLDLAPYRGRQIAEWMYRRFADDFAAMTNLPRARRLELAGRFTIARPVCRAAQISGDGRTRKYLLAYADGEAVETVRMSHPYGHSVCVSTQAGCNMGCAFCASTLRGKARDLTGGEILAQVVYQARQLEEEGGTVGGVVLMGSGEPLENYDNVLRFIRLCHQDYSLNLSYRAFTLSTAGLVPQIDRLAAEGLPITLSISLHAPYDALRSELMPVNRRWPIRDVVAAGDRYAAKTGRRLTYEYTLIKGVNDRPEEARALARLLGGRLANVNLIPVNAVPERGLYRPEQARVEAFARLLRRERLGVTVRREMGGDIQAACGQLRNRSLAAKAGAQEL